MVAGAKELSNQEKYKQTLSQKLSKKWTHDQMNQKPLVELFDNEEIL